MSNVITDYHNFTTIDTPKEERRRLNIGDIWINGARCHKCDDIIRSCNRYNYVACGCGAIAVDGGSWYCKRAGDLDAIEDEIVMYSDARSIPE